MTDGLKACPFCGGEVSLEQTMEAKRRKSTEWWGVVCRNTLNLGGTCAIEQRPSRTKESAIKRWNLRSAAGEPVAWIYELAESRSANGEYCDWAAPKVRLTKPCVPDGSIRNLRPLYALTT